MRHFVKRGKKKREEVVRAKTKRTDSMLALIFVTNHPGLQLNLGLEKYFNYAGKRRDQDGSAWCGTGDGITRTWVMRAKVEAKKQTLETVFLGHDAVQSRNVNLSILD